MEQKEITSNPELNFKNLTGKIVNAINKKSAEAEKLNKPQRNIVKVLLLNGAYKPELIDFFNNNSSELFKQIMVKSNRRTYPMMVNFITYQDLAGKSADRLQREINLGLLLPINPDDSDKVITSEEVFNQVRFFSNLAVL